MFYCLWILCHGLQCLNDIRNADSSYRWRYELNDNDADLLKPIDLLLRMYAGDESDTEEVDE